MGIRQKGYWLRQADAIRRQYVAAIAYGVNIGMSGEGEKAMDELELTTTVEESRKWRSEATWNMLKFMGRGTGV